MAEFSEGEAEIEGEEFEGEDIGQPLRPVLPAIQEPPPESDSKKKTKGKRKKPPPPIRINLSGCKYEVLRIVQRKLGWKEVGDDEDWEIYWTDTSVSIERIMKLTRIQKINHFSGMLEICRKRAMARNLMKMARQFPQHFDFFPKTFILPGDKEEFMADIRSRGKKQVYILKPDAGCQGRGIRLIQGGKEEVVARVLSEMATPNVVAQHYLSSPLLIHGYKFDLRIYALVLSCDPLRVFLFHEGLARICTEKYSPPKASNLDVSFMHLTNYAVNKKNEAFVAAAAASADSSEDASKWCLAQLRQYLTSLGHSYEKVWADIGDLIIKSLCSVQPILRNNYRSVLPPDNDGFSCFEILGYDIMLDEQLRPWLIEVNHSPSFNIDSPLDLSIKEELITQTIELVRVDPKLIAKTKKAEKRAATSRLLEPMHVKKPQPGRGPPGAVAGGGVGGSGSGSGGTASASGQLDGKGDGEEAAGGGGGGAAAGGKPRTPEEYEAWRSKVLTARERYESKHMGNFTRIFPSPDPTKQALYEELLKGAAEIFQASFQARSKRLDAAEEKRRKEDAETDAQKAERLKAKAHRDKLAQMAVERRKIKMLQQQQQQGQVPMLPAYLMPPQPYLASSAGQQQQPTVPLYYVPLMQQQGTYQYDPSVYQQLYMQQAYLYGSGTGGQRLSEVYGERSDGAASVSSSRPVSALSNGSGGAGDLVGGSSAGGPQQPSPPPPIRIYSGPLARTAAGQRPGSSTGTSGRNSPMAHQPAGSAAVQLQQLQQQLQSQLQLQQQGALPPHPFLGSSRRPSSATSRASAAAAAAAAAAGASGGGEGPDWTEPFQTGRVGSASGIGLGIGGCRTISPPSLSPGGGGGGVAPTASWFSSNRAAGTAGFGVGAGSSHSFSYGPGGGPGASALQQLQEFHAAVSPFPHTRPVSVGSAHNHVRHAHSTAMEAAGALYPVHPDAGAGEREQQPSAPGNGPGAGPGPGRGLIVNGSRPPSATANTASIRDKLQPGSAAAAATAAAAAAAVGAGQNGPAAAATGPQRKNSLTALLGASSVAAAATWDAAMAAAAAAAGHDPAAFLQYFNSRARPESPGHRLRPTSAASCQRSPSPSPLGTVPGGNGPASAPVPGMGSGLGVGGVGSPASPNVSRSGSGNSGRYGGADMYVLGLTHSLLQQAQTQTQTQLQQQAQPAASAAGTSGGGLYNSGSPKVAGCLMPQSPRGFASTPGGGGGAGGGGTAAPGGGGCVPIASVVGPWDTGQSGGVANAAIATSGRAYKQSRATGVASYPALTAARAATPGAVNISAGLAPQHSPPPPQQQQQQQPQPHLPGPKRQSEGELEEEDGGPAITYHALAMPDTTAPSPPEGRFNSAGGGGGSRHWSAAPPPTGAAQANSRQRSLTGAGGVYVPAIAAPVMVMPAGNGSPAMGPGGGPGPLTGPGVALAARPPVYPPSGGSPSLRAGGAAPTSGRAGGGGGTTSGGGGVSSVSSSGGAGAGASVGKAGGGNVAGTRLNVNLSPSSLVQGGAGGAAAYPGLSLSGSGAGRGGSAGGLQGGIEGLQITATGLDLDSQLRSAALAALNRKGLTVKGKKVAQQ